MYSRVCEILSEQLAWFSINRLHVTCGSNLTYVNQNCQDVTLIDHTKQTEVDVVCTRYSSNLF